MEAKNENKREEWWRALARGLRQAWAHLTQVSSVGWTTRKMVVMAAMLLLLVSVFVIDMVVLTQPTRMEWEAKKVAEIEEEDRRWRRDTVEALESAQSARLARICAATPDQEECTANPVGWFRANATKVSEFAWGVNVVIAIGIGVFGLIWLIRLPQRRKIAHLRESVEKWSSVCKQWEDSARSAEKQVEDLRKAMGEAGEVVINVITAMYASRSLPRREMAEIARMCRLRLRDKVLPTLIPDKDERDAALERERRKCDPDEKAETVSDTSSPSAA